MPTNQRNRLAKIRRFDQLVVYLRDELGWPINTDDFEELTFEYTPDELGVDERNAAKIQEIKRLRPLVSGQPWGIFFVKFEPKRLPVVVLRRILGQVTIKKRASVNRSDRQAWAVDDLLFVSNYGEGEERQISFAHFSKSLDGHDLPTLKVLGWNNLNSPLHLDAVARELIDHLTWPDDEGDTDTWRENWRAAFTLHHREVIDTSKQLSERLAELARAIRDRTRTALSIEIESGPLTKLMKAFQNVFFQDLDECSFADMYAQTIAYGLLSARIHDPKQRTADDLSAHMRTNPFLKELMETFLQMGGRHGKARDLGIDFDELGISEVVGLLDQADMEAVIRDFGDRNPREDPVIHFYEHFLSAYDQEQRIKRGVFYTPRPVVSFIVRSVDELLRKEFGLEDGLADITTWGEITNRSKNLKIPDGTTPEDAFVQILDPATGTGTFLVEVIDLIHKTMEAKWESLGHNEDKIQELWNSYVPKHLLPRLYGYELLMAPYAIAHLKVGLKLFETGYHFNSDERARVYLTDSLEPASDGQVTLDFLPALAKEAEAVNEIKRKRKFTVVIGNPPYLGEAGRGGEWIATLMRGQKDQGASYFKVEGKPLKERNSKWLNDLYVKFTRFSHYQLEQAGIGVLGFITNHGYIDNPTFRGMRYALLVFFDQIYLLDLHGNIKKRESTPDGIKDENVFDIEQGVAVGLFVKVHPTFSIPSSTRVYHVDSFGSREKKYNLLLDHTVANSRWTDFVPRKKMYLFKDLSFIDDSYDEWTSITEIFPVNSVGIVTARDALTIQYSQKDVKDVVSDMIGNDTEYVRNKYQLGNDVREWSVKWAQEDLLRAGPSWHNIVPILYRLFDIRYTYYTGQSRGFLCRPRSEVMEHLLAGTNAAIITCRQQARSNFPWSQVFATSKITESCVISNITREINYLFPLYLYPDVGKTNRSLFSHWPKGKNGRTPNLDSGFIENTVVATEMRFVSDGPSNLHGSFCAEDVFAYIYSVFHSPNYRRRYDTQLKLDFPRVPIPGSPGLFRKLVESGRALLAIHLLESLKADEFITTYSGSRNPEVGHVGWWNGTIWLDASKTNAREGHRATNSGTNGFHGVPEEVWDFHIGSYQVCHKWLKDRKGRMLSDEDITHYQKIVDALSETIRIMAEVDEVIENHGGWPDAFQIGSLAKLT